MKLETHAKIGIWVGIIAIVIGMTFFTLHESQSLKYEYGRMFVDQDAMLVDLKTTGTFEAFTERWPYFYEEFNVWRDGSGNLEVYAFNNQTGNRLELGIRYDQDDQKIDENISCRYSRDFEMNFRSNASFTGGSYPAPLMMLQEGHARGQFVEDFIQYTACLDDPTEILGESEPTDLVCGVGTIYEDGVCIVVNDEWSASYTKQP